MLALQRPVGPEGEVIHVIAHQRGEDLAIDIIVDSVVMQSITLDRYQLCHYRKLIAVQPPIGPLPSEPESLRPIGGG